MENYRTTHRLKLALRILSIGITIVQADPTLTNGDLAVILPGAGIAQGLVSFLGKLFIFLCSYLSIYNLADIQPGAGIAEGLVFLMGNISINFIYISIYVCIYILSGSYSTRSWYSTRINIHYGSVI